MTRFASIHARALAAVFILAGCTQTLACNEVTMVTSESPIQIQAQPPAPPLPNLPAVPQPPVPPRVTLEGDLLGLDEALSFDAAGVLSSEHQDILGELANWLEAHPEVLELTVEVHSIGEGSRRAHKKRSNGLATQIVDALVAQGVASERLIAASVGASPDGQRSVALRISKRAEAQE
ncbi:OmpA family protein [Enhygromyxa salina]|nr:OmpA family protein [Enhygromyxa salina]